MKLLFVTIMSLKRDSALCLWIINDQKTHLMRNALTSATNKNTKRLEMMKLQSSGQPSNPHFGSSLGIPFNQRMVFVSLNWNWGNSSFGEDTKEPTCCIVMAVSFTYCMEKTEKLPSAFPFSSIKTWLGGILISKFWVGWKKLSSL